MSKPWPYSSLKLYLKGSVDFVHPLHLHSYTTISLTLQGSPSGRGRPKSAWADGNWAEEAGQVSEMVEH